MWIILFFGLKGRPKASYATGLLNFVKNPLYLILLRLFESQPLRVKNTLNPGRSQAKSGPGSQTKARYFFVHPKPFIFSRIFFMKDIHRIILKYIRSHIHKRDKKILKLLEIVIVNDILNYCCQGYQE